jgi:LacI family transcriptional regulator
MRSAQVTIKDIAKTLGISPSTVSKALKDHAEISKETKKAVKDLAKKMGYRPNALSLSLLNSRSNVIGVIIPELMHYFFSTVISGIQDVAYNAELNVMVCQSNELYHREVKNTKALLSSRVEGVIASVTKDSRDFNHFRDILDHNIPLVLFDRVVKDLEVDTVETDDYNGAFKATEHLISVGCERIAHLSTSSDISIGRKRREGYIDALKKHKLPIDEKLILNCDNHDAAELVTKRLIYELKPPDGIFAVNDLTALGAINTIKDNGLKVPEDIAVCGFSNGIYSSLTDPKLTTVEQHGYKMGKRAAEILIDRMMRRDGFPIRNEIIETDLIIRDSSKRQKTYSDYYK